MRALEILGYIRNNDYIMDLLDKTDMDEAITELEALQSRSCEWCKHFRDDNHAPSFDGYCVDVGTYIEGENELLPLDVDRGFCCNRYEPKDNQ